MYGNFLIFALSSALAGVGLAKELRPALFILDMQDCFLTGSLPALNGSEIIPVINRIREESGHRFELIVLSQDWHCPNHMSFATTHPPHKEYDTIELHYTKEGELCINEEISPEAFPTAIDCTDKTEIRTFNQTLWPEHCVFNITSGPLSSSFHKDLYREPTDYVVHKGTHCDLEDYSAFFDFDHLAQSELDTILRRHTINLVMVTGLTLDYCLMYTAMDGTDLGYLTVAVEDATRGFDADDSAASKKELKEKGIRFIQSREINDVLDEYTTKFANMPTMPIDQTDHDNGASDGDGAATLSRCGSLSVTLVVLLVIVLLG